MAFSLGVDVGSGFSKAVLCKDGVILSSAVVPSGGNYRDAAEKASSKALAGSSVTLTDIAVVTATGYGAQMVDFANQTATDISCHAAGVLKSMPSARTIIDVGAQYSRAIKLDEAGRAANFVQNEKCAGGSGKFLHVVARILHMSIEDIGPLSLESTNPVDFTTGCAVFAESEAVSRISEGALPADILAGVHKAMAAKIVNLVVRLGLTEDCVMVGGGAKDIGLVKMLELDLGVPLLVPEHPQITAAYGAALIKKQTK
jgi:(R)-2-hydroxyacyl-CoA dehydratese activating ATPase